MDSYGRSDNGGFPVAEKDQLPFGKSPDPPFLAFLEFPVFSPLQRIPCSFKHFPLLSQGFVGSAWQDNPCFFASFHCLLLSGTKQGEGDQGKKALEISCFAGSGAPQGPFWKTTSNPTKVGKKWVFGNVPKWVQSG